MTLALERDSFALSFGMILQCVLSNFVLRRLRLVP